MLIAFFDNDGIIHEEFIPAGQTVNSAIYEAVLKRFLRRIQRVRPELHRTGNGCCCMTTRLRTVRSVSTNFGSARRTRSGSSSVLPWSGDCGLLSISPPEKLKESRRFCRRDGNPRTCDKGSAIDSYRGLCWKFPEALWTLPKVFCEGWQLFRRPMKLICLYPLFWLFSDTIHRHFWTHPVFINPVFSSWAGK